MEHKIAQRKRERSAAFRLRVGGHIWVTEAAFVPAAFALALEIGFAHRKLIDGELYFVAEWWDPAHQDSSDKT